VLGTAATTAGGAESAYKTAFYSSSFFFIS